MGVFEMETFADGTKAVAQALASRSAIQLSVVAIQLQQ